MMLEFCLLKRVQFFLCCFILLSSCNVYQNPADKVKVIRTSQGVLLDQSYYEKHWVIFNYWASWCTPCVKEISQLNEFHEHFKNRGVRVVGINVSPQDKFYMQQIKDKWKIHYPIVTSNILSDFFMTPEYIPVTVIMSPHGHIKAIIKGEVTERMLVKLISTQEQKYGRHNA